MQNSSAYLFEDWIIFITMMQADSGLWYSSDIQIKESRTSPDTLLGGRIIQILGESRMTPGTSGASESTKKQLLKLAGTTSAREFYRLARLCSIRHTDGTIEFAPYHMANSKGAYVGKPESEWIHIPYNSPHDVIGATLREAIERSQ